MKNGQCPMHAPQPIEIGDGQTFLIIVQGERVLEYTWGYDAARRVREADSGQASGWRLGCKFSIDF